MRSVRQDIGGLGNLMFKNAYLWAQMRDGVIPDIYVQSEKYFKKYREEIKTMYGQGIVNLDRVALHIRRGDYLKAHQFHVNLWETDYYKKAVKLFPNEKFLVFCKDRQSELQDEEDSLWCKQNIPSLGIDFEIHNHSTETEDLNVMASCKSIIGAASSFSWFAAYLGNPDKRVVMPRQDKWFTDGIVRTELPQGWIQIDI